MADARLTVADLSPDQLDVYESMFDWSTGNGASRPNGLLTVGGYAGCGKTTLLGVFAANTDLLVAYVTLTGRASSILRRKLIAAGAAVTDMLRPDAGKGTPQGGHGMFDPSLPLRGGPALCTTIHRLLYKPIINGAEELIGWRKREELDRQYDLIVVDEASMVGDEMLRDLQAHGLPILAVGDHGQLPPVMDSGALMRSPDLRLEKIHRQAAGNPIIALAHHVRTTGRLDQLGCGDLQQLVRFVRKADANSVILDAFASGLDSPLDVGALCWTNRTRVGLNATVRKALGRSGPPKMGEVLICLKNKSPVFNGMRGVLAADTTEGSPPWIINARLMFPDEGLPEKMYDLCAPQFCREKAFASVEELNERGITARTVGEAGRLFDFGYAMTTHKAQGSGFKHAIVYVDRPVKPESEDWRRWMYTSVTRATERLTIIC